MFTPKKTRVGIGGIVNELRFSLQINIFSHIACGYKKKVHTKRAGLRVTKTFSDCVKF